MKKIIICLLLLGTILGGEAAGGGEARKEVSAIPQIRLKSGDYTIDGNFFARVIGQNKELPEKLRNRFKDASCLTVRNLAGTLAAKVAPYNTDGIYEIKSTCEKGKEKSYFLKEIKSESQEKEIERLIAGSQSHEFSSTYINKPESKLNFVYPLAFINIKDKSGKEHFLSLMPKAEGTYLVELIKDFKAYKDNPELRDRICSSYYNLGKQMSKFYKKTKQPEKEGEPSKHYSKRHGDLHAGNIFIDKDGYVSLIDNETVVDSFRGDKDICKDIAFLFLKSFFLLKWTLGEVVRGYPYQEFFEISLPAFIGGYLSQYPRREAIKQFEVIGNCLKTYKSDKDPKLGVFYNNSEVLGIALNSYIDPILNRLGNWLRENPFVHNDVSVNDRIDDTGKTSLHKAAERERLVMCPLIQAGADVNTRDSDGNTPLAVAVIHKKEKAAALLRHKGAR
jgi:hypothetical protein